MPAVRNVLIIGGGIGGLSAAIALRNIGCKVDVAEINAAWSVYGVGIIQPNNALRALDRIGVAEECVRRGFGYPGWRFTDSNGAVFAEVPSHNKAAPGFPPINGISRPNLHQILSQAALDHGVNVRLGITVDKFEQDSAGVSVRFTDGTTGTYDLMIGADGTYSPTRKSLFGDGHKPTFNGQAVWRYNFPRPSSETWGVLSYGKRSKAGLVPMSNTTMYLLLVTPEPGNPRMPEDRLHILMQERLAEYGGIYADLRKDITDPKGVVYKPMEPMLLPPPWHVGRTILIGDAAHATTPHMAQGAAIAIEDAVLLAELLSERQPLEDTLRHFTERRYPRCRMIVEGSLKLGQWELAEWDGKPDPDADPAGLMDNVWNAMAEPL